MQRILKICIYVLWGLFTLLISVYLTFPTDLLKTVVERQAQAALGPDFLVQVEDVSLAGLSGVTIEGMRILPAGRRPTEGAPAEDAAPRAPIRPTNLVEAAVTANLFALIGGGIDVSVELEFPDGAIYAEVNQPDELEGGFRISVDVESLNLMDLGLLGKWVGTLGGELDGDVTLDYSAQRVLAGGSINLTGTNLVRGAGPIDLLYIETPTRLGTLNLEATLEGSDLTIQQAQLLGGPDVEISVTGRVAIRNPMAASNLTLDIIVGFDEAWKENNGLGAGLDQIPFCDSGINQCALQFRGPAGQTRPRPPPQWR